MLELQTTKLDGGRHSKDSNESKCIEEKAIRISNIKAQLKESLQNRYIKARSAHSEFAELLDSDIQTYIDAYDRHVAEGFHPASIELFVGGCFMFFNSLLFANGGTTGSVSADKGQGHILAMSIISLIVSAVGSAFAIAGQSMLKFDSISQEQNITLKFDLTQIVGAIKSGAIAGSASCNNVHFSSAFIIGFIAGITYKATC
jgi:hypothetical protein